MKKNTLVIATMAVIFTIGAVVTYLVLSSRRLSPPATASYSYNGLDITVDYFRPSKRGRVIFGDSSDGALQPNGKYWRLGANNATEITFNKDIMFGGKPVTAGTYRMYATLAKFLWVISLNSELGKWGADEPNYTLDVVKVDAPVEKLPALTELFTITFDSDSAGVNMHFAWDKTHVKVPIGVQQEE